MSESENFLAEHGALTRRYFLRMGAVGVAAAASSGQARADETPPELARALEKLEPYFTPPAQFRDVSRGRPLPHSLPEEKRREVGLTRETWKLEVTADPDSPAKLGTQFRRDDGTAIDFKALLAPRPGRLSVSVTIEPGWLGPRFS